MKKLLFIFLLISVQTGTLLAQSTADPSFIKDSLNLYIQKSLTNWRVPGAAVCIVKDGRIVFMKGFGVKEMGTNNKVDEHTLFMIGSNTKAFTATALTMLENEKKLSLTDLVSKYLNDFKLDNKPASEQVNIQDLLCHRLGFETFQGDFTYWTSNLSRKEVIEKMSHVKALYPFRTTWGYTNAAFVAAGEIIPQVSDKSWEVFIKESIFAPLGMNNTLALSKDITGALNKSAAHTMVDGVLKAIPYAQIDNLAAAGSISSSVSDMSKWVMMLLNHGKIGDKQFIPEAVINKTWTPASIMGNAHRPYNHSNFQLYGLGWELQDYEGRRIVMHTGGVNGFVSSVTLVPEENLGIIILTNTDQNSFYEALKWDVLDIYFKLPFRNYNKSYLSNFQASAAEDQKADKLRRDTASRNPRTNLSLGAYTGKYFSDLYGNMTIIKNDGELQARFEHHPKMFARLQALGGDRFYVTFSDPAFGKAVFPFHVMNNKVQSVTVKVADFVEITPYEFKKVQ